MAKAIGVDGTLGPVPGRHRTQKTIEIVGRSLIMSI